MQWPKFVPSLNRLFRLSRLAEYGFRLAIDEGIQLGIQAFDAIEVSARDFDGGSFFSAYAGCDVTHGKKRV
jgi:hypothetical protein